MKSSADFFRKIYPFSVFLVLFALFLAWHFAPHANSARKTVKERVEIPNYDIRGDKNDDARKAVEKFISEMGKTPAEIAGARKTLKRAETGLQNGAANIRIENNPASGNSEVITPDVWRGANFLTAPTIEKRAHVLRNFLKQNADLFGLDDLQIEALKTTADYTNPDGNLSYVHYEQFISGIPVFQGEVKAGFTRKNEIIRIINNLAPNLDYESLSNDFGSAESAVKNAVRHINLQTNEADSKRIAAEANDLKVTFGRGQFSDVTTAEKMYFPVDAGVARTAWCVLLWTKDAAFYVIVDARDGTLLWRKNITDHQTQPATYEVYGNLTSLMKTADSPAPSTPGCNDPTNCPQPPIIARQQFTLIGNEPPYTFNNTGWIPDSENRTTGNNVEAGIDRDGTNGVDPLGHATGNPNRTFVYVYNPAPGNPPPGEQPAPPLPQTYPPTMFQQGSVTNAFYVANRFHDEMYRLGFTEQARNFQLDNFGRGGVAGDHLSVEVQDSSGTNGGNFVSPADGGRGRLQAFIWTGPTPDRDAGLDAQYLVHEMTHGVSNRLHGNSGGLTTNFAAGMGEGWSDFYALALLSEPTDDVNGIYSVVCYITAEIVAGFTGNCYYGIRRFPVARISVLGPNGLPHNPLTFRYINAGCNTLIGTTTSNPPPSSAYPRGPIGVTQCDQVHNVGEVWAAALWEVHGFLVDAHGGAEGNRRALQYITDGMKLAPLQPTFLQERDAILAATAAINPGDVTRVWRGFAARGMGFSASIQNATSPIAVTEAFNLPDLAASTATVTSGNGLLEPNECNTLNVPVNNFSGSAATGITAVLSSNTPGITVAQANSAYPDIPAGGSAVNNTTPYQVSVDSSVACFTTANFTLTLTYTGGGGGSPATFNFSLPIGQAGLNYNFTTATGTIPAGGTLVAGSQLDDAAVTIPLPAGWTSSVYGVPVTSLSASTNGMLAVNGAASTIFTNTALPANVGGANPTLLPLWDDYDMDPADVTDGGIYTNVTGTAPNRQLVIEWRAQHFAETANGPITVNFAVVLTEGSDAVRYLYALTGIAPNQNGASATVGVQRQSTGTQFTQFSFNQAIIMPGLQVDGARPPGQCAPGTGTCAVPAKARADFDGDGKTDISVFRPSEGNWYLNRSTAGFGVVRWGLNGDTLAPGDYDGDGKTDYAVFRRGENSTWYILNSQTFTVRIELWGATNIEQPILFDKAVAADYDGDGKADLAVWRTTDDLSEPARFLIKQSSNNAPRVTQWGSVGDIPAPADYDGDSKTDLAIYRGGNWWILSSVNNSWSVTQWGLGGDKPVAADYDGDSRDDLAVFRPSDRTWYVRGTTGANIYLQFGLADDILVPGDYDGNGKTDIAVYRDGIWYINLIGNVVNQVQITQFGLGGDKPIPNAYLP